MDNAMEWLTFQIIHLLKRLLNVFRTQSMQSVDFYASSEEGGFEEAGGKPGHKINEYQAAWNVTNAIQVPKISKSLKMFM